MASTPLTSAMLSLGMTNAAAATVPADGYKALVCIFLDGGADSFNLIVPTEDVAYTDYHAARGGLAVDGGLALPKAQLLPIKGYDGDGDGRGYGLHPGLTKVQGLYESDKLAFVANVGSLVEPVDLAGFFGSQQVPLGLFSHNDQRKHWHSAEPHWRNSRTGWAGRMSEVLNDPSTSNASIFSNIAVGGTTLLQTGSAIPPYVVSPSGNKLFRGYGAAGSGTGLDGVYTRVTDQLLASSYQDLLRSSYAENISRAIDTAVAYRDAISQVNPEFPVAFPNSRIGNALRQVALAIGARTALGQSRQVFFVNMPGWDHHDNLLSGMDNLVPQLSEAMNAFYHATVDLGVGNDVVSFTASDFGRTLSSNGDGSDHAWGGNQMIMGGAVNRGVYGAYPETLALGNELDVGRGRIIPTTSTDEYSAELASWFGIPNNSDLELILPNIRNFYPAELNVSPSGVPFGSPLGILG